MAFEFHLPDIGEGVVEGEIVAWKVKVGDVVELDQPIVEIMTDKATVEIPSPRAGTIAKINFTEGQVCPVGQVLLVIEEAGGAVAAARRRRAQARQRQRARQGRARPARGPRRRAPAPDRGPHGAAAVVGRRPRGRRRRRSGAIEVIDAVPRTGRVLATPATRRLARKLGVDLGRVAADRQARPGHLRRRPRRGDGRPAPQRAGRSRPAATRRSPSRPAATRSGSRCAACASGSARTWPARPTRSPRSPTSKRST